MANKMDVRVDQDFARFGNKSYAINKINSVEVRERKPHGLTGAVVFGALALLFGMSFLGQLSIRESGGGRFVALALAAIFGCLAYLAWKRSKTVEYQLFLMTSSSEAQALVSRDGAEIQALRNQIEGAMTGALRR